jgi:hypothetical protein
MLKYRKLEFIKLNEQVFKIYQIGSKYVQLKQIPIKSITTYDEYDIFGMCDIIYDTKNKSMDIYEMPKKEFNQISLLNYYDVKDIENNKFIYKTITLNDEVNYDCINVLKI